VSHSIPQHAEQVADAIVALINSRTRSPTKAELLAVLTGTLSSPQTKRGSEDWRAMTAALRAALPALRASSWAHNDMIPNTPEEAAALARWRECEEPFDQVRERAWAAQPSDPEGCVLLAEIAKYYAYDWPEPYPQIPLTEGDYIDSDPARLALGHLAIAVLRLGGRRLALPAHSAPAVAIAIEEEPDVGTEAQRSIVNGLKGLAVSVETLSRQHMAYRDLRAEVDHYNHKASQGDEPDDDGPFNALLERVSDMEKAIWSTPATTLADVLLRAEIAENNENGMMDDLDNPDAYLDDRAMAQLTRAVLDVLGGRNAL
jgi:hypothetical protein